MALTVKDTLNKITPTDTAQMLGRLQFGDVLNYYFTPSIDSANRTNITADVTRPVDAASAPQHGKILHVHATTGGAAGPKAIVLTGVPAAGEVLLEYETTGDAAGQPKLTFAAADAITAYRLHWIQDPLSKSGRTMRAEMASQAP